MSNLNNQINQENHQQQQEQQQQRPDVSDATDAGDDNASFKSKLCNTSFFVHCGLNQHLSTCLRKTRKCII